MSWTEERTYRQDVGMGFTLEMTHADGGRVEHQFRSESLDDLLMYIAYFVRGCGFVIDGRDILQFHPDDSDEASSYEQGYAVGRERMREDAIDSFKRVLGHSSANVRANYTDMLTAFTDMMED